MPRLVAGTVPELTEVVVAAARGSLTFGADETGGASADDVDVSYSDAALNVLSAHSSGSWWNEQRVRWARRALRGRAVTALLEVGAGNGAMSIGLREDGVDVVALEPLRRGCLSMTRAGVPAILGTLARLDIAERTLPAVGYFDVLEHIEEPDVELRVAFRALASNGLLLVTVPAYPWLWSGEDEAAGHHRRYTARSLRRECEAAGFVPDRVEHLFASLVLPAAVARLVPRRSTPPEAALDRLAAQLDPPAPVARAADAAMRAEHALARLFPLPFGTTIAGVFRKP